MKDKTQEMLRRARELMDSGTGITSIVQGRRSDKCLIIDDYYSLSESDYDAQSKIWATLSRDLRHHVTSGLGQHPAKVVGAVMDEYPLMESHVRPTLSYSPITTGIFPHRVKLIISAIKDSAAIRNTLSW